MKVSIRYSLQRFATKHLKHLGVAVICCSSIASIGHAQDDNVVIPEGADGVTINNPEPGAIVATGNAIKTNANTEVDNAGLIDGGVNGVNFVNGLGSGRLTNSETGRIQSDSRAVNIGGSVELSNDGLILGTGNQRNGTVYSDSLANNFSIQNTGTIDAGAGNQGSGIGLEIGPQTTATIENSGVIQGRTNQPGVAGNSGLSGDGLRLANFGPLGAGESRSFDGSIVNSLGGLIASESQSGTIAGLRVADTVGFQGSLDNAGTISGNRNGLYFGNADHTGGTVRNSGTISSGSRALNIDGSGLSINNSGSIIGTGDQRNGTVYADSTAQGFTLSNNGRIDAGQGNSGAGFSVELSDSGNDFTINNNGLLAGRGNASAGAATAGDGIRLERTRVGGVLDGSTTGRFTGTINNAGVLGSDSDNGTTGGFCAVNGVDFAGELRNGGNISGTQNGVYFGTGDHSEGSFDNQGTVSSDSRALNIDGIGLSVNNSGSIVGTGNQRNGTVYADSTAQGFSLNNGGTIDAGQGNEGAGFSVELSASGNDFTINNSGQLAGRGNAGAGAATAGDGIRLERTRVGGLFDGSTTGRFTGTINNSGDISSEGANGTVGGFRAVNGVDFQGELNNSGTISGIQNGVYFGTGDHTDGVVNNRGQISSDSRAFNIDGNGLRLNNTGAITATGRQRNGTVYVDGTADNFTVNNSGSIDARSGAGSGLSVQVGSFDGDIVSGIVQNSGTIAGSGLEDVDAGLRFFTNANNATFSGNILNQAGGVISGGENSAAVLFDDNTSFDGSLINSGRLDGSVSLNDGNLLLTESSVLELLISGYDDFESVETDGSIGFDGILDISFADSFRPLTGQTFDLFDFSAAFGEFDEIRSEGVVLDISDLDSLGSVSIVAAVPEPSSLAVVALSGIALLARRRRKA